MIRKNIESLKRRIATACSRIGRNPADIKVIAVTKTTTPEMIKEVMECGITDIGENRLQDATTKFNHLRQSGFSFYAHMVGHLQTNKALKAVEAFDLIQSVDSLKIASEINRQAAKKGKIQDILVQVNTSFEASKFGLKPEETLKVIKDIFQFQNLKVKGLMTIAPLLDDSDKARPYFRKLRELKNSINDLGLRAYGLEVLSMGMTDDFEVAIEEGSNMIRVGRLIFEG